MPTPGCSTARTMRWGIVMAAFLITVAAWPLYHFSRQELAPVEDQNHISLFFEASAVLQVPGIRLFPRLDPPLPTPGQYDVELIIQSDAPADRFRAGRGVAERQVFVRGH